MSDQHPSHGNADQAADPAQPTTHVAVDVDGGAASTPPVEQQPAADQGDQPPAA